MVTTKELVNFSITSHNYLFWYKNIYDQLLALYQFYHC